MWSLSIDRLQKCPAGEQKVHLERPFALNATEVRSKVCRIFERANV